MTAKRLFNKCVLRPEDVQPTRDDFEVAGVFNPGAVEADGQVILLVRVAERPKERRKGFTGLPRWDPGQGPVVDWLPDDEIEVLDPRVVCLKQSGALRLTFVSHIRVFRSRDGRCVEAMGGARFEPETRYETYGVEDPRVACLDGVFYITYVAVSEHGAATALASTTDFKQFTRHGVIFYPENKDVVLFSEKVDGQYMALHRPNPSMHFSAPAIWLGRSPDLIHWGRHEALHSGASTWESGRIGAGAPPLKTNRGWLEIYHGQTNPARPGSVGTYCAGLLLLEAENPGRVAGKSTSPILVPETDFELGGSVPGVVFPTGVVQRDDRLLVYYGAADTFTGLVELSTSELLAIVSDDT